MFSPLRDIDFAEGFVSFRTLCGVQSSLLIFARNHVLECGPPSGQTRGEALCF